MSCNPVSPLRTHIDRSNGLRLLRISGTSRATTCSRRALAAKFARWMMSVGMAIMAMCPTTLVLYGQEIAFPLPAANHPIRIGGQTAKTWQSGQYQVVQVIRPRIEQADLVATADEAIVLIEPKDWESESPQKAILLLEGNAMVEFSSPTLPTNSASQSPPVDSATQAEPVFRNPFDKTVAGNRGKIQDQRWLGRLFTDHSVEILAPLDRTPQGDPAVMHRIEQALAGPDVVQQVQYLEPALPGMQQPQQVISPLTGQMQTIPAPGGSAVMNRFPLPQDAGSPAPAPGFNSSPAFGGNSQPNNLQSNNLQPNNAQPNNSLPGAQLPAGSPGASATGENRSGTGLQFGRSRVDISARDATADFNLKIHTNPANPYERVFVGAGGIRVSIDNPQINQMEMFRGERDRLVTILADNVVAWQTSYPNGESSWEIYLEGNVVFNKGSRVIFADRMYYHADQQRGTILNADMLTSVAQYPGLVRLKADVVQQADENTMTALGAAFTTSRLGVPRYWLQANNLQITRESAVDVDATTGAPVVDLETGMPQVNEDYFAESQGNYIYVADRPVFFWPRFRTNLSDPTLYLNRLRVSNDRIFGFQTYTGWNMFQVLGIKNKPEDTSWIGVVDYLSERGLALGSEVEYKRDGFLGMPGQVDGFYQSWAIRDSGLDTLGRGRVNMVPEEVNRGNFWLRHRHRFYPGFQLKAEVGYLSDRNFLEQFYERRWDTEKDMTTGLWLERNIGTQSFNAIVDWQINDFFTQTSWLPRVDHMILGQPLFGGRVVWHGHSHAGYGRFRIVDTPQDAQDLASFDRLAWEAADATGVRAGTRQELDLPLQLGPAKVVPYVLGDVTYWQEDLSQNDLVRGYGQLGLKSSLPFWKVDPTIHSTLWNVNGLAHKVTFDSEILYADSSQDLDRLPLYDPLDDDAQEHFRHRFGIDTFGLLPGQDVDLKYDERYLAMRRGMQGWVVPGSVEIAEDLAAIKFGVRQRWQTKRGLPGQERVVDWITFDVEAAAFPKSDRDNFGADYGLLDYEFEWHMGDRVSLVSDGFFDFFSQGLRTASVGMHFSRPEVGNLYLGYRMIEGPISSNIITASTVYRMSDKCGIRGTTAVDFGETGTIGNSLNLIYIGESFMFRFGVFGDPTRDNYGFQFGLEPRFIGKPRLFRPGNVAVAPASSRWLE